MAWLREVGWDGEVLGVDEVGRWLTMWIATRRAMSCHALSHVVRGCRAVLPHTSMAVRAGRAMFRGRLHLSGIRNEDGVLHEYPTRVQEILWRSREALWA